MRISPIDDTGLMMIEPDLIEDERGCFAETLRRDMLEEHGIAADFVQENFSRSERGVIRGLHYQHPRPQGKLIRCISGAIYDVAVDLRRASDGFGRWTAVEIHAGGHHSLWIPPGFAHGFYAMSDQVEICYQCTDYYLPDQSQTIAWDDPTLDIQWPFLEGADVDEETRIAPILSESDRRGDAFTDAVVFEAH
jgi:dTDP-4-dehydrorhamnose 3,5-epimerase